MKKKIIVLVFAVLVLANSVVTYAKEGTSSLNFGEKHGSAKAELNYKFKALLFGEDKADASTSFVIRVGKTRVAVRLEGCNSKGKVIDYKYNSSSSEAKSGELSLKDVSSFRSRHSIDSTEANGTYKELTAESQYVHE